MDEHVTIRVDGDLNGQVVLGNNNTVVRGPDHAKPETPALPAPERHGDGERTRVFVSYVRADLTIVNRLVADLTAAGYDVWIDHARLLPGMRWKTEIKKAIAAGDFFVACFSPHYWKPESYMNEELIAAVQRLRLMPRNRQWFIPAKLVECELPDLAIGPDETIADAVQYADFGADWNTALRQVLAVIGSPYRASQPAT